MWPEAKKMNIDKILSMLLANRSKSEKEKESKEAANVIDRVIKKNKETFDELAKH